MPPLTKEDKIKSAFDKVVNAVEEFNTMEKFDLAHWVKKLPIIGIGNSVFVQVGNRIVEPNQIKALILREDKPESFITCELKDNTSFGINKTDCYART